VSEKFHGDEYSSHHRHEQLVRKPIKNQNAMRWQVHDKICLRRGDLRPYTGKSAIKHIHARDKNRL